MEKNLKVGRIDNILKDRFGAKIDMSNTSEPLYSSCYFSRAIAATAVIDVNRVDFDTAAKAITDGGNDMGIDAIYVNKVQKVSTGECLHRAIQSGQTHDENRNRLHPTPTWQPQS